MEVILLAHVPPLVVPDQVCEEPIHIGVVPVIICAIGAVIVTVRVAVFIHPPTITE